MRSLRSIVPGFLFAVGVLVALPFTAYAQEASVIGTVTDSTGGVLPGVTVTGVHEATGNTFVGVTDERGAYRLPLRVGVFKITAELVGFGTVTRTLELAVGQQAVVNLLMAPSALQESVTVTGEAPLIDVSQSRLGGNVDTRQMQALPINGRNWMTLTLLAPGSRANAVKDAPVEREGLGGLQFQMNLDGQSVTDVTSTSGMGEPRFSRDAIGEFEFITNRFDATQGRTTGVQVNAVTKSGTNTYGGSASAYFRDDRFNAADFVAKRVLKYSDQQVSTTFGGPIKKDKAHFFGHYEGEREPQTISFLSAFPRFNLPDQTTTRTEHKYGLRLDAQLSSNKHLMVRGARFNHVFPFNLPTATPGASLHASRVSRGWMASDQLFASFTQTLGQQAVNEIKGGYTSFNWYNDNWNWFSSEGGLRGGRESFHSAPPVPGLLIPDDGRPPGILLRGYSLGTQQNFPQDIGQDLYNIRDNFSFLFSAAGRHEIKFGGEYIYNMNHLFWAASGYGEIDAQGGPIPANIEDLFPVWNDWKTWNIAALSPITRFYRKSFGPTRLVYGPRDVGAAWFQDNWAVTKNLTLNLGVRWDVSLGSLGDRLPAFPPFRLAKDIKSDWWNIASRLGFAYTLGDTKTVIRGGYGKYYGEPLDNPQHHTQQNIQSIVPTTLNDGRPNFAADPYNGQIPTFESIIASGIRQDVNAGSIGLIDPTNFRTPYSHQGSIGFERQLGETMAVEADYAWTGGRREVYTRNVNLSYNPATGANYPFSDVSRLPYPQFGLVPMSQADGWSNYHGLQTAFTKRFSQRWQAGVTYTLSTLRDATGVPNVGFAVAPDIGGEYTLAVSDQRHRAVFNGIWEVGYGFQLSGLYFFGSGMRYGTIYGGDLRGQGIAYGGSARLRPNGTIVSRNDFVGDPIHRVDLRVQRRFPIRGRVGVDGIFEVYNLFNHANYGSYTTVEVLSAAYGKPVQNINLAYQPRMLQLAFRFTF